MIRLGKGIKILFDAVKVRTHAFKLLYVFFSTYSMPLVTTTPLGSVFDYFLVGTVRYDVGSSKQTKLCEEVANRDKLDLSRQWLTLA